MNSHRRRLPHKWWTAILILTSAVFVFVCSASFVGTFRSVTPVTLTSERAGLVMESGAKVKMRGVQVGRVAGVTNVGGHVSLKLEMYPDQLKYIPANVGAEIRATTAFGSKYVDLVYPEQPSTKRLSAGAVLQSRNVSTEVNTVFENVVNVLKQVEPAKLNAVLTALADGLRGQGEAIGEAITDTHQVLAALNPRMPVIEQDWRSLKEFSDTYNAAAVDIVNILDNVTTTSSTLSNHADQLNVTLLNSIGLARSGTDLLAPNQNVFVRALNTLKPTTDVLLKYNPEYTCSLLGVQWAFDHGMREAAGLNGRTALLDMALSWAQDMYQYPDNLPRIAAKGGPGGKPGCGSLPDPTKNWPVRYMVTDTGWGTGIDLRPNPGIAHRCWANFLPVTRAVPEPPSIRECLPGPAIGPVPYPGAPPYGAPLYSQDGTPLYPPPPGAPAPPPPAEPAPAEVATP